MIIKQAPEGGWMICREPNGEPCAGPFATNAEAWRWLDRANGEQINKAEERSDWLFEQIAGGKGL